MGNKKYLILYPFSLIYRFITDLRNRLYDSGVFRSVKFDLPVICVGNITAGGTGKTPHTEYMADLLRHDYKTAVLSRGYKRKTKGFQLATGESKAEDIGDEPLQIYRKFPDIVVAVDEDRVHGVRKILEKYPGIAAIILDDAFQHRRISPGFSILLTDYSRLIYNDDILPYGLLREKWTNCSRADVIIVTKTPPDISPAEMDEIRNNLRRSSSGRILFSFTTYSDPVKLFDECSSELVLSEKEKGNRGAVLVTGIANPEPFKAYAGKYFAELTHLNYPDHHFYNKNDLKKIIDGRDGLKSNSRYVITTEKDAVRLREFANIAAPAGKNFYFIPAGIGFLENGQKEFDNLISEYVRKNYPDDRIS